MIYTIFLYQSNTGSLIYDKSFQEVSAGSTEMFSSFLTAMKSFVSELILDSSKELKNIELGEYSVLITSIPKIKVDLVIITDKEDLKSANKVIPKLIKLLHKYELEFQSWDGNREEFKILDIPLTELIVDNVKDVKKSLIDNQLLIKSIWARRKQLSEDTRNNLIQERDLLIYKLEKMVVLPKKIDLIKKIIAISEQLEDEATFLNFQNEIKKVKKEISDTKLKLEYYLKRIKTTLNKAIDKLEDKPIHMGDYKDTYLNLYSFSTKLKLMKKSGWEIYRDLANILIEKDSHTEYELSDAIQTILKMSSNLEDYLN